MICFFATRINACLFVLLGVTVWTKEIRFVCFVGGLQYGQWRIVGIKIGVCCLIRTVS